MMPDASRENPALILDGKACSAARLEFLRQEIAQALFEGKPRPPQLVVIQVGEVPASTVYVNKKQKTAEEIGMLSRVIRLPESTDTPALLHQTHSLNAETTVDGILVQLPLPAHIDEAAILEAIAPEKDVDGFHPINVGRLYSGQSPYALPCTPAGMMTLLKHYDIEVAGKDAVVLGRSNIVGKPIAQLLLQANATVTICHSRTKDLDAHLKRADILVAAIGKPHFVRGDQLKPGAVVLDVGINRLKTGKLAGDVDFDSAMRVASAITPVPGGVGPMTIASLLENTFRLYMQKI